MGENCYQISEPFSREVRTTLIGGVKWQAAIVGMAMRKAPLNSY